MATTQQRIERVYLSFRDNKKNLRMIETTEYSEYYMQNQMELRQDIFDSTGIVANLPIFTLIEFSGQQEKQIA